MSILSKIRELSKMFQQKEEARPQMPDFDSMDDPQLDVHINRMLENMHRQDGTRSYDMAVDRLKIELREGLITEREFEMFIEGEKRYWSEYATR